MERRDRSVKALENLNYITSLEDEERAQALLRWVEKYLPKDGTFDFDLEIEELEKMSELFYTNLKFLKEHKEKVRQDMVETNKLKKFLKH